MRAADPGDGNVTVESIVIAMSKSRALLFMSQHDMNNGAKEELDDLVKLVQEKVAVSAGILSVTGKDGLRGVSEAGTTKLEMEPLMLPEQLGAGSPFSGKVDVVIRFSYRKKEINTALTIKSGGVKFLGSFDSTGDEKNVTYFVFVRVTVGK